MPKGLIEQSTLTAIADAIRAKTETTDTMLPSEMAGLIEGLGGGCEILTGSFTGNQTDSITGDKYITYEVSLGVKLPDSENFVLVVFLPSNVSSVSSNHVHAHIIKCVGGVMVDYTLTANPTSSSATYYYARSTIFDLGVSDADGTSVLTTHTEEGSVGSNGIKWLKNTYEWWYCYG